MDYLGTSSMVSISSSLLGACLLFFIVKFLYKVWWKPISTQNLMKSQGIKGPLYRFFYGNTKEILEMRKESFSRPMEGLAHHIFPKIQPHFHSWINKYGRNFVFWYGPRAQLVTMETDLIKEVLNNKGKSFPKVGTEGFAKRLLGEGLVVAEGEKWAKLRKLANHAFHAESLKNMTPAMISSAEMMLQRWENYEGKEIEVYEEFKLLTSEVISRTAFGSSYAEGKEIFEKLARFVLIMSRNAFKIRLPILSRLFKTRDEIESEELERGIRESIIGIMRKREKEMRDGGYERTEHHDHLRLLMEASGHGADDSFKLTIDDVIDDCKTFYLGGYETTTSFLTWTFLLLGIHTHWQEKARQEVFNIFGQKQPNSDGLSRMKTINMIINETLRLYPPIVNLMRRVEGDIRLGKFNLSANMVVTTPTLALHHDTRIWGDDAHLFKPERFSEGIAKATNNDLAAFQPFGMGPRSCVGNNFAINEAKIALSMVLQRYSFTLSPNYIHSPVHIATVRPQHGVQILLHPL